MAFGEPRPHRSVAAASGKAAFPPMEVARLLLAGARRGVGRGGPALGWSSKRAGGLVNELRAIRGANQARMRSS